MIESRAVALPRGGERIQQLMEEFPEISRREVVTTDVRREGIRPNETTRRLGRWALPDAPVYFERNKEAIYQTAERLEGYYLNPVIFYFGDGVLSEINLDSRSPYELRYEERGRYRLYRDEDPIDEVFFPPRPDWYDRKTSSGKPMPAVIGQVGEDLLKIGALTYCEYFKDGKGCRYCNINPSESVNKEAGLVRLTGKRDQDIYETMLAACQEGPERRMIVSGGVILDTSQEADNYARIIRVLRQAEKDAGSEARLRMMVRCQAMEPEDTRKLKEAGATNLGFNLEVWSPRLFEIICPGKSTYVGQERWKDRLVQAVDIFGRGNVESTLIQGLEMVEPYGFKTEDEAAESYLEGADWMLEHGIANVGYPMRCVPGTEFAGRYPPRTEYHLRLQMARSRMYRKYQMTSSWQVMKHGPGVN